MTTSWNAVAGGCQLRLARLKRRTVCSRRSGAELGRRDGPLLSLPSSCQRSAPISVLPLVARSIAGPVQHCGTFACTLEQPVRIRGWKSGNKMLECGNRPSAVPPGLGDRRQAGQRGNPIEATSQRVPAGLNPLLPTLPGVGATAGDESRLEKPQLGGTRWHCFQLIEMPAARH
jgi:hypothetical protein